MIVTLRVCLYTYLIITLPRIPTRRLKEKKINVTIQ